LQEDAAETLVCAHTSFDLRWQRPGFIQPKINVLNLIEAALEEMISRADVSHERLRPPAEKHPESEVDGAAFRQIDAALFNGVPMNCDYCAARLGLDP